MVSSQEKTAVCVCDELKDISKDNIPGMKIKKQDTFPSYNFGESQIDPKEKL